MYASTPSGNDLSRSRLKQLATWIRDELDILVAREGPDILKPDDVLTLHETFLVLRQAQHITMADLRATGIHKAVQDIAGVATRWPSRLCDDCDNIISIWTPKFGPFRDIHPFLYGRGGRLEGIASVAEYTREALLKRWAQTCPDKIHPKRSHKLGNLGFTAGQWWINSLFAHHAGIIGLESCEGGTTYDKHGAYALLLKDTGEIEACSDQRFSYRVPQNDKGKFRLTSATPKSRDPIRVLRSHSINSVWGPKAGVRYEGLYGVRGWSVAMAKTADTAGGRWKQGDILFDVRFERIDSVPMEEVIKRPTAYEVDDYSEYKRLRKLYREGKRRAHSPKLDLQPTAKVAPSIQPQPGISRAYGDEALDPSHNSFFHEPHFKERVHVHFSPVQDAVSPMTITAEDEYPTVPSMSSTLAVPATTTVRPRHSGEPLNDAALGNSPDASTNDSSGHSTASRAPTNIREVAPWIEFDATLTIPSPTVESPDISKEAIKHAYNAPSTAQQIGSPTRTISQQTLHRRRESPSPHGSRYGRRRSGESRGFSSYLTPIGPRRDIRKSSSARTRNPMGKLLDGIEEAQDYFQNITPIERTTSLTTEPVTPKVSRRDRASSSDGTTRVHSPVPNRQFGPPSPTTPLSMARRNEICSPNDATVLFGGRATRTTNRVRADDPFVEANFPRPTAPIHHPLERLISPSRAALPMRSPTTTPASQHRDRSKHGSSEDSAAARHLRKMMDNVEVRMAFTDPFSESEVPGARRQASSSMDIAPDFLG